MLKRLGLGLGLESPYLGLGLKALILGSAPMALASKVHGSSLALDYITGDHTCLLATLQHNCYSHRRETLEWMGKGSGIMPLNSPGGSTLQWIEV